MSVIDDFVCVAQGRDLGAPWELRGQPRPAENGAPCWEYRCRTCERWIDDSELCDMDEHLWRKYWRAGIAYQNARGAYWDKKLKKIDP